MRVTERTDKITPFYVMEVLEQAKAMEAQGEDIVHMEVGEPDFATPLSIKEEAFRAIGENHTFYTHSLGLPNLRVRISRYYQETEGVEVDPERIIVTNGTSGALLLLCALLLDRNRILAITDPGYPCYKNFGFFVDAGVLSLPVSEETRFEVGVDHFTGLPHVPDIVLISSPSNPTGIVYREETISQLHEFLSSQGGILIVDEIYAGLSYIGKVKTSLTIADDIIVVNGFSKMYAMTGWRLGWMVVPYSLIRPIQKLAQNIFISPPSISQYAAMRAFDAKEDLENMRKTYEERRNFLLPKLKELGFRIPINPEGAFYIYASIERWGLDSMSFVMKALQEAKVAITPGYDFGSFRASSYVRFSYANSLDMLREGCKRLELWLQSL